MRTYIISKGCVGVVVWVMWSHDDITIQNKGFSKVKRAKERREGGGKRWHTKKKGKKSPKSHQFVHICNSEEPFWSVKLLKVLSTVEIRMEIFFLLSLSFSLHHSHYILFFLLPWTFNFIKLIVLLRMRNKIGRERKKVFISKEHKIGSFHDTKTHTHV